MFGGGRGFGPRAARDAGAVGFRSDLMYPLIDRSRVATVARARGSSAVEYMLDGELDVGVADVALACDLDAVGEGGDRAMRPTRA